MLPKFSFERLLDEFDFIIQESYRGVKGVHRIDSKKVGPVLGITINTHGNEPSGLAALSYFRKEFNLPAKLLNGSVIFVLNNIKATELYFQAFCIKDPIKHKEMKERSRVYNLNMNRLPADIMENNSRIEYEVLRSRELFPIWKEFEVALDIHSATQDEPMIVACGVIQFDLIRGFPIKNIISNITNVQINKPAIHFYGENSKTVTLGIESGSHENEASFNRAIQSCIALFVNLGMISKESEFLEIEHYDHFKVVDSIIFENNSYTLARIFKTFDNISKGTVIAKAENLQDIISPIDGHTLFATNQFRPTRIDEEILFLSEPVVSLRKI